MREGKGRKEKSRRAVKNNSTALYVLSGKITSYVIMIDDPHLLAGLSRVFARPAARRQSQRFVR